MNSAHTSDVKKFAAAAKRLLKKVAAYTVDGGDMRTATATEIGFAKSRDRLEDSMRALGVTDDASCLSLISEVKLAVRGAGEAARAVRMSANDAEIRRLRDEAREIEHADPYARELKIARIKGHL